MEMSAVDRGLLSAWLTKMQTAQQKETAIAAMGNRMIKQEGEAVVELLSSIPTPSSDGVVGTQIDVSA